jgi:hypothetical protein
MQFRAMIKKLVVLGAPEKTDQQLHLWGHHLHIVAASNQKMMGKERGILGACGLDRLSEKPWPLNMGCE